MDVAAPLSSNHVQGYRNAPSTNRRQNICLPPASSPDNGRLHNESSENAKVTMVVITSTSASAAGRAPAEAVTAPSVLGPDPVATIARNQESATGPLS